MTTDSSKGPFRHIHHTDKETILKMYNEYHPVFSLTTGRSGTKFLSSLLDLSDEIQSYHEAFPGLQFFADYAFHNSNRDLVLSKMIDASRMELILDALIKGKIYTEANQCLTFFAYQLKDLFRESKFIHLIRHPGDFIASAVGKGWYKNDSLWEEGRIRMDSKRDWDTLDQVEKLAWLWQTSNHFVESFKNTLSPDRVLVLRFEDLVGNVQISKDLFDFIGVKSPSQDAILKLQGTKINRLHISDSEPPNMFKRSDFPAYSSWPNEYVEKIRPYVEESCILYDYSL